MSGDERWRVETVSETGSTNADVAERFRAGEGEGLVLVAEHQTAGRGRLGREWVTTPGSSLTVSFLLVPEVAAERWSWLPLLTGIATAQAVRRTTGVEVALKWPNDVLVGGRKVGGILLERVSNDRGRDGAVVGIGLNLSQSRDELPVPEATSLALESSGSVDRTELLAALLGELESAYDGWVGGGDVRARYLELCSTPGQQVRVAVPGGEVVGEAVDIDEGGRLVVRTADGNEERLAVGDVVHVRPDPNQ
jgi:BirA family transcriptional regulator, biotin operon repressor / biotin---[acetyl-CoA-carboxylase] ligase